VWYLDENKFLTLKSHSEELGGIHSIAFSPDGKTLASGATDKTIKIWQLSNGQELSILTGHSDHVSSVTFSPDGKTLASGSKDKTVRLWQVETKKEIRTFTESEKPIYCVVFSPDGKTLAAGANGDNTIMLLPCD
ncbi:MAG: WD40 repeat domain-containing protein, partial [Brasilonema sp.]